jgi:hypothetical protein
MEPLFNTESPALLIFSDLPDISFVWGASNG